MLVLRKRHGGRQRGTGESPYARGDAAGYPRGLWGCTPALIHPNGTVPFYQLENLPWEDGFPKNKKPGDPAKHWRHMPTHRAPLPHHSKARKQNSLWTKEKRLCLENPVWAYFCYCEAIFLHLKIAFVENADLLQSLTVSVAEACTGCRRIFVFSVTSSFVRRRKGPCRWYEQIRSRIGRPNNQTWQCK